MELVKSRFLERALDKMQNMMYLMLFGSPWTEPRCKTVSSGSGVDKGMENVRQEPHCRGSFRIVVGKRYGELQHRILVVSFVHKENGVPYQDALHRRSDVHASWTVIDISQGCILEVESGSGRWTYDESFGMCWVCSLGDLC